MTEANPIRTEHLGAVVPEDHAGLRLDQSLARLFPDFSRSRLQQWIKAGQLRLNGQPVKAKDKVFGGEQVELTAAFDEQVACEPEPIPLDIVHEDAHILVLNKPAGLVVHPAAGNPAGTLQNALLHHDSGLVELPRAGIVHRLDKDTSGLLVVARTPAAHKSLVEQLQARTVKREYRALVMGEMVAGGTVDEPIGRHPVDRKRMAVTPSGKPAVTHYHVHERFRYYTLLRVLLETGRTHQIRVHMSHAHYPLVGDPSYGGRLKLPPGISEALQAALRGFRRQALHARALSLVHPESGETLSWEAALPEDFSKVLTMLRDELRP